MSVEIVLIVACARHRVIGINNALPWHLPEDLAHFKRLTTGHCMIMGRKTFESIGKPLPNRRSIVVTRYRESSALRDVQGIELAASLDEAIMLSEDSCGQGGLGESTHSQSTSCESSMTSALSAIPKFPIFIIGGAQLYEQALNRADRIELTEIDLEIEGDAFFPEISESIWGISDDTRFAETLVSRSGLRYRFLTYLKK